jgi:hypothetical protein
LGLFWAAIAAIEGGDWMPHARLLLPALACFALAAGGLDSAALGASSRERAASAGSRLALRASVVLVLAASVLQSLMTSWRVDRTEQRWRAELAALLDWTSESGARSIGLVDIGRVGFYSRLEVFDFGGLVDPVIARSSGGLLEKQFDLGYLFEQRRPDLLLFRFRRPPDGATAGRPRIEIADAGSQVEVRILTDPRLSARYRPAVLLLPGWEPDRYRDRYGCRLIFARRDGARPLELGGASTDGPELQILTIADPLAGEREATVTSPATPASP